MLGMDRRTVLFKVPEGTVFGETVSLRHMEVSCKITRVLAHSNSCLRPCSSLHVYDMQGDSKARRIENMYCQTECDMLQLSSEDLILLCENYPQVNTKHFKLF